MSSSSTSSLGPLSERSRKLIDEYYRQCDCEDTIIAEISELWQELGSSSFMREAHRRLIASGLEWATKTAAGMSKYLGDDVCEILRKSTSEKWLSHWVLTQVS